MPYRLDVDVAREGAAEALIDLGALDVEVEGDSLAAILPDSISPEVVREALRVRDVRLTPTRAKDDGSIWRLRQRPVAVGEAVVALHESEAFGTGLHHTTALCLDALHALLASGSFAGGSLARHACDRMLDVGTGSGVLALAALKLGAGRALGIDTDPQAIAAAAKNAELNGLSERLDLRCCGPGEVEGTWPLVVANIRAAELMELAPAVVRRVASGGQLVLSGIPQAVASEVERTYLRLGMVSAGRDARGGWTALIFRPSW